MLPRYPVLSLRPRLTKRRYQRPRRRQEPCLRGPRCRQTARHRYLQDQPDRRQLPPRLPRHPHRSSQDRFPARQRPIQQPPLHPHRTIRPEDPRPRTELPIRRSQNQAYRSPEGFNFRLSSIAEISKPLSSHNRTAEWPAWVDALILNTPRRANSSSVKSIIELRTIERPFSTK